MSVTSYVMPCPYILCVYSIYIYIFWESQSRSRRYKYIRGVAGAECDLDSAHNCERECDNEFTSNKREVFAPLAVSCSLTAVALRISFFTDAIFPRVYTRVSGWLIKYKVMCVCYIVVHIVNENRRNCKSCLHRKNALDVLYL